MAKTTRQRREPALPTERDQLLARDSSRVLARHRTGQEVQIRVQSEGEPEATVAVPPVAFEMFLEILSQMSQGHAISVIPVQAELSTQQAADILNVSRPFVVRLLDEGKIPSKLVGTHRRVQFGDLMAFKQRSDQVRQRALEELAAQAQELHMGYQ